jgi:hypothetical protein
MSDCLACDQSGTGLEKLMMPGIGWYRTKPRQSGIFLVRNRTEIIDAGMAMPEWQCGNGDAGTAMPERRCRNGDAGVSFLDADAQLCIFDDFK